MKYAPIYFEYKDILELLSDEQRGKVLMAIISFCEAYVQGEEYQAPDDLDNAGMVALIAIEKSITRVYEKMNVKKANGSKGGRPKTKKNLTEPNETEKNLTEKSEKLNTDKEEEEEEEEEKNEEEESLLLRKTVGVEPKIASAPPVITLPLNDGNEHPVTEEMLSEWAALYPAVDVMQQLRNMRGWLLENPARRKTKRGIGRFIVTWLSKEQDRGGVRAAPSRSVKRSWADVAEEMEAMINDDSRNGPGI